MTHDLDKLTANLLAAYDPASPEDRKWLAAGFKSLLEIAHATGQIEGAQMVLARYEAHLAINKAKEKV